MQGAPEKISISLVEKLNKIRNGELRKTPFLFTHMKQDVAKLREASIGEADVILGIIASLEGDEVEMRRRHKNAIRFGPSEELYSSNYGVSLAHFLYFSEAAVQQHDAFTKSGKIDIALLKSAIDFSLFAGMIQQANGFLEKYNDLLRDEEQDNFAKIVRNLIAKDNEDSTITELLKAKLDTVFRVLRENKVFNIKRMASLEDIGDETWWRLSLLLPLSLVEVVDLENSINEELHKIQCEPIEEGFVEIFLESDNEEYHDLLRQVKEEMSFDEMVALDDEFLKKIENTLS